MANFDFIDKSAFGQIKDHAQAAEKYVLADPRASAIYSRLCLEYAVYWLFDNDANLPRLGELRFVYGKKLSLDELINLDDFVSLVDDDELHSSLFEIKRIGNKAVHKNQETITKEHALTSVELLYTFLLQLALYYQEPAPKAVPFDAKLLPLSTPSVSGKELQLLKEKAKGLEEELSNLQEQKLAIQDEIEALQQEREQFRKRRLENAQKAKIHPSNWTEKETRIRLIDVLLMEAGWEPEAENVREFKVEHLPRNEFPSGTGKADYVLWDADHKPLAVVEAKKTIYSPDRGRHQAKLYADGLEEMFGQRPIIFYTNGFQTWLWDDTFYPQRKVMGFLTKEELRLSIHRRKNRKHLLDTEPNRDIVGGQGRAYQLEAVTSTCKRFCANDELRGSQRKGLLVMATGAGKTRTAAAIIELLAKANWSKRALFLADRTALVSQAKTAIAEYLPAYTCKDITQEEDDASTRIVFSTYQTMINRIEKDEKQYSIGHFDLIIIDEAHRSIYKKYRSIFDYFDSLLLGLTATPRGEVDRDTFDFFNCAPGEPTYSYDLFQAADEEHLLLPKGIQVDLGFIRSGIRYDDLSDEEKKKYEETFTDEFGIVPAQIDASAINEWLYNKDTVKVVLEYLMKKGIKVADKVGKTIIFAKNRPHAELIQQVFIEQYPQYGGDFCQVVHYQTEKAGDLIDRFKQADKLPRITVSVDMLDTGIDVPEIVNLVLFKPVYSKSKYWQMIGRGTRKRKDLFGPGQDKEHFYLFDFCGNFEFFNQNPDGLPATTSESVSSRIFRSWLELATLLSEEPHKENEELMQYRNKLLDKLHFEVNRLLENKNNISVRRVLEHVLAYSQRDNWNRITPADRSLILEHIAPIVEIEEPDQYAKRFDHFVHQAQISLVNGDPNFDRYKNRIVLTADSLRQIGNVPHVQAKLKLIKQLCTADYWNSISVLKLEEIRQDLRGLIQHIDRKRKRIYHTNFTDKIEDEKEVENIFGGGVGPGVGGRLDTSDRSAPYYPYQRRLVRLIEENINHIAIQKLRRNEPITEAELKALQDILLQDIEEDQKGNFQDFLIEKSLGVLIRKIVGLDEESARMAFAEFERKHRLTDVQMKFLKELVVHLKHHGVVEVGTLYDRPFKELHSGGFDAVFRGQEGDEVIDILRKIKGNAVA